MNVAESGATLTKIAGCDGCADGTAVSNQQVSGSGMLQFSTDDSSSLRFVGLGGSGIGATPADVDFAIRLQGGVAEVRESGAYRTEIGFGAGDTFTITVNGSAVSYAKNGGVFYTSSASTGAALRAHVIFFGTNGSVRNVGFGGGASTAATPAVSSGTMATGQYAVARPAGSKPVRRRK